MNKLARDEKGYALIAVLILLLLGSLLIPPLLGFMTTGLKTGLMYENKTDELYAADAGIEAGLWRIKYNYWGGELHNRDYDIYDYNTTWSYQTETVNGMAADVTIQNVWIPMVPNPYASTADTRAAIEEKLVVVGTSGAIPGKPYRIMISYTPDVGDNLTIKSLGVWLPQGFEYADNCSLTHDGPLTPYYPDSENITDCNGGQTIVWSYNTPYPLFTDFPEFVFENGKMSTEIIFSYTPPAGHPDCMPTAIAWITTEMVDGSPGDVPISWDVDTRIYKIISTAGDTSIEAYSSKSELRQMGDAMSGDYVAIGGSLLSDDNHDNIRETWYTPSSFTLNTIPEDADVIAAYLYWAGWRDENSKTKVFSDTCTSSNLTDSWQNGGDWECDDQWRNYYYRGQHTGDASRRYLTMTNSRDLSPYPSKKVIVSWKQRVSGTVEADDGLDFALSADSGSTWSSNIPAFRGDIGSSWVYYYYFVPDQYLTSNFKLRFDLVGMDGTGEYCHIDDIQVSYLPPDTSITFKINDQQVYLDGEVPAQGAQPLTTERSYVMPNSMWGNHEGFSYACMRDVSALVRKYPVVPGEEHHTGNAIYTVDGVSANTGSNFSFAGWSLIVVYTSPQTAGHYLYIRDDNFAFHPGIGGNLDFDEDGQPGGDITNFVVPEPIRDKYGTVIESVAAKLTCFVVEGDGWLWGDTVKITGQQLGESQSQYLSNANSPVNNVWNGQSYPGTFNEGVDIDTFEVLWDGGPLLPGDKSLQVDLESTNDAWNLVYLILSVRSETVTSGTTYYMIGGG